MKFLLLLITIFFINKIVFSQRYMFGFFSPEYIESNANSNKDKLKKRAISIIYNDEYCVLNIEGMGVSSFRTYNYSKTIEKDGINTFFANRETSILMEGYYGIYIVENKKYAHFQIVTKTGYNFFAAKADKYSENGKITKYVSVDYDKYIYDMHLQDSIIKIKAEGIILKEQQQKAQDIIYKKLRDSSVIAEAENKLELGDNFNNININWMADTVAKNLKVNAYCYGEIKVNVNANGIVTNISAQNIFQGIQFVDLIKKELVGRKTEPWIKSSKAYPSYCLFYVNLEPSKIIKKKKIFGALVERFTGIEL